MSPVARPGTSVGRQGAPQSVDPLANDTPGNGAVPLVPSTLTLLDGAGNPVTSVTVPNQGTYTIADGRIVFTPLADFTGTATPVTYRVADANQTTTTSTYTPTVTDVAPTANPDRTSGKQGRPQSIDPLANDTAGDPSVPLDPTSLTLLIGDGDATDTVTIDGQGTYTIDRSDPAHPRIVFTPLPGFTGEAQGVDYRIADANGTTAVSRYTPTLVAVKPVAKPDRSSGPLNTAQSIDPFANDTPGDPGTPLDKKSLTLLDASGKAVTSVKVDGQGTYTIKNGKIVFTPERGFVGTADPVTYRIADVNGTRATSTYTPTVTAGPPIEIVLKARGPEGTSLTVDPVADVPGLIPESVFLVAPDGQLVDELTIVGEGTWTVDPATGKITFDPLASFSGNPTPVPFVGVTVDGTVVTGVAELSYYAPALPPTGAGAMLWPAAGLGLLALAGGVALLAGRRRRLHG